MRLGLRQRLRDTQVGPRASSRRMNPILKCKRRSEDGVTGIFGGLVLYRVRNCFKLSALRRSPQANQVSRWQCELKLNTTCRTSSSSLIRQRSYAIRKQRTDDADVHRIFNCCHFEMTTLKKMTSIFVRSWCLWNPIFQCSATEKCVKIQLNTYHVPLKTLVLTAF